MNKNVGKLDRVLRIVAGTAILAWGISAQNWFGLIGLLPLATGLSQWCPAYCPFGISTANCCGGGCCGSKTKD